MMTACQFKIDNIASDYPLPWELIDDPESDSLRSAEINLATIRLFLIWIAGRVATDDPWGRQNRSFQLWLSYAYYGELHTLRFIADNLPEITHGVVDRHVKRFVELAKVKDGNRHPRNIMHRASQMLSESDCDSIFKVFLGLIDNAPKTRDAKFEPFALILMHHSTPSSLLENHLIRTGCRKIDIRNTAYALYNLDRYLSEGEE